MAELGIKVGLYGADNAEVGLKKIVSVAQSAEKAAEGLTDALDKTSKALDSSASAKKAVENYKAVEKTIANTVSAYGKAEKALMGLEKVYSNISEAQKKFIKGFSDLNEANRLSDAIDSVVNSIDKYGQKTKSAAKQADAFANSTKELIRYTDQEGRVTAKTLGEHSAILVKNLGLTSDFRPIIESLIKAQIDYNRVVGDPAVNAHYKLKIANIERANQLVKEGFSLQEANKRVQMEVAGAGLGVIQRTNAAIEQQNKLIREQTALANVKRNTSEGTVAFEAISRRGMSSSRGEAVTLGRQAEYDTAQAELRDYYANWEMLDRQRAQREAELRSLKKSEQEKYQRQELADMNEFYRQQEKNEREYVKLRNSALNQIDDLQATINLIQTKGLKIEEARLVVQLKRKNYTEQEIDDVLRLTQQVNKLKAAEEAAAQAARRPPTVPRIPSGGGGGMGNNGGNAFGNAITDAGAALSRFQGQLALLTGGASFGYLATEVVKLADNMSLLEARVKLVTPATEDLVKVQDRLTQIATENRVSLEGTITLYTRLQPALARQGRTTEEVLQVTDAFNKSILLSGANSREAASALLQFSQAMASGKLAGDEFRSVSEAAPAFLQAIADGSGIAREELKKLSADGKLTTKLVTDALLKELPTLLEKTKNIPITIGQAVTNTKTIFSVFINELNKTTGATESIAGVIQEISAGIGSLVKQLRAGELDDEILMFKGLAVAVVTAFSAYKVFGTAAAIIKSVTTATEGLTLAQKIFNLVAGANPYVRLATALVTVGTVLYSLRDELKLTSIQTDNLGKQTVALSDIAGASFEYIVEKANNLAEWFKTTSLYASIQAVGDAFKIIADAVSVAFDLSREKISEFIVWFNGTTLGKAISASISAIADAVGTLTGSLGKAVSNGKSFNQMLKERTEDRIFNDVVAQAMRTNRNDQGAGLPTGMAPPLADNTKNTPSENKLEKLQNQLKLLKQIRDEEVLGLVLGGTSLSQAKQMVAIQREINRVKADVSLDLDIERQKTVTELLDKGVSLEAARATAQAGFSANLQGEAFARKTMLSISNQSIADSKQALAIEQAKLPFLQQGMTAAESELRAKLATTQDANLRLAVEAQLAVLDAQKENSFATQLTQLTRFNELITLGIDPLIAQKMAAEDFTEEQAKQIRNAQLLSDFAKEQFEKTKNPLGDLANVDFSFLGSIGNPFSEAISGLSELISSQIKFQAIREAGEAQYAKQIAKATKIYGKNSKEVIALEKDQAKFKKKLSTESAKEDIKALGSIAAATKGFFKEKTAAFKILQAAETAFRAAEIALAIESFLVKAKLMESEVLVATAKNAAIAASSAIAAAVSSMVGLPFPLNLAALAATVAAIGALGVAIAGGGGGGGPSAAQIAAGNRGKGIGTTLGDSKQGSESLTKGFDILSEIQDKNLSVSTKMLEQLRSINNGVNGFAAQVFQFRETTGKKVQGFKIPQFSLDNLSKLIPNLIQQQIISFGQQTGQFRTVQNPNSIVGATSGKLSVDFQAAQSFSEFFIGSMQKVVDVFKTGAPVLGAGASAIGDALKKVNLGPIDIKGLAKLKGDELQERLSNIIGAAGDTVAEELNKTLELGLKPFQKIGEGLLETMIKVTSGVEEGTAALEQLGISAINYTQIANKQGDVAAELVRSSILAVEPLQGIADIISGYGESADEIVDVYNALQDVKNGILAIGGSAEAVTSALVRGAGGIERLQEGLDTMFSDFLSPAEQAIELSRRVAISFAKLGVVLPESTDQFKKLIDGIDKTTEEGQNLYGAIVALAPAFIEMRQSVDEAVEAINDKFASLIDKVPDISGRYDKILTLLGRTDELRQRELASLDPLNAELQRNIYAVEDAQKALDDLNKKFTDLNKAVEDAKKALDSAISNQKQAEDALVRIYQDIVQNVETARKEVEDAYNREMSSLDEIINKRDEAQNAAKDSYERELAALDEIIAKRDEAVANYEKAVQAETDALQETISSFNSFIESLRKFRQELSRGQPAMLNPKAQYEANKAAFLDVSAKAKLGDKKAIEQLQDISTAYLEASKEYYASSEQYFSDLEAVKFAVDATLSFSENQKTIAEMQLDALNSVVSSVKDVADKVMTVTQATKELEDANQAAVNAKAQRDAIVATAGGIGLLNERFISFNQALQTLQTATQAAMIAEGQKVLLTQQVSGIVNTNANTVSVKDALVNLATAQATQQTALSTIMSNGFGAVVNATLAKNADQANQLNAAIAGLQASQAAVAKAQQDLAAAQTAAANAAANAAQQQEAILKAQRDLVTAQQNAAAAAAKAEADRNAQIQALQIQQQQEVAALLQKAAADSAAASALLAEERKKAQVKVQYVNMKADVEKATSEVNRLNSPLAAMQAEYSRLGKPADDYFNKAMSDGKFTTAEENKYRELRKPGDDYYDSTYQPALSAYNTARNQLNSLTKLMNDFYAANKTIIDSSFANGGVFSGGVEKFATGGAFTNSVVSSPTMFNMGLMGEAGPEAIVPLARGSDGSLGVRIVGGMFDMAPIASIGMQTNNHLAALVRVQQAANVAIISKLSEMEERLDGMESTARLEATR